MMCNYALDSYEMLDVYYSASNQTVRLPEKCSEFDFTGDCVVNLADFTVLTAAGEIPLADLAHFSAAWLECGLVPTCFGH